MDRWETIYYYGKEGIECPTCDAAFRLEYMAPITVEDFRHCPNCGERLAPPKEE